MTASTAASRGVPARTPVAPLPPSWPKRPGNRPTTGAGRPCRPTRPFPSGPNHTGHTMPESQNQRSFLSHRPTHGIPDSPLCTAHDTTPPHKHGSPLSAELKSPGDTPGLERRLQPARAVHHTAHDTTPPHKHGSPLSAELKSPDDTPGLERRLQPARAVLRTAHDTTPPHKHGSPLSAELKSPDDTPGLERRLQPARAVLRTAHDATPRHKHGSPPQRGAQEPRRRPRLGTPASAGTRGAPHRARRNSTPCWSNLSAEPPLAAAPDAYILVYIR